MMKKITLLLTMGLGSMLLAQSGNVFADSENNLYEEEEVMYQTNATEPGGPGDPAAPIDDYLPVLMVAGVVIALYAVRQRQALLNK